MNILIQGPPRIGKTTVIIKLAKLLKNPAGFYTEEIREEGKRVGFCVRNFQGEKGILAHQSYKSKYRVGKYRVNVEDFERVALPALERGLKESAVLLIDEIGKMEMFSTKFREKVKSVLESPLPVVATIPEKPTPQIKEVLKNQKFRTIKITTANRDSLPLLILNLLKLTYV